jgi:hypothetical protein
VLTPLSFARIPPPLPRSSRKMLATLSSLPGFGLRLAPTISTGTLGFSRLARRSIFIVVCTLADSLHEPFASRASTGRLLFRIASTASDWNLSCRAGYLPPTGFWRPYHGAPEPHPTIRQFPLLPPLRRQPLWNWPSDSTEESWEVTSQGRITQETPVRTEPHRN